LCSSQDTIQVLFDASPEASFIIPDDIGCAPFDVSFTMNLFKLITFYGTLETES